jgi:hypothetical protein
MYKNVENLNRSDQFRKLSADMKIILKEALKSIWWPYGLDLFGLGQCQVAGFCENGNEIPCSVNMENFLTR